MKKEEISYLKIIKGEDCNGEIKSFIDNQKGFKLLKRENRRKDNVIKKLTDKIRDLKNKVMNQRVIKKSNPKLKSNSRLGKDIFMKDVSKEEFKKIKRLILRIKYNMEDKKYTKTDLLIELMIPKRHVQQCIDYLIKDGFFDSGHINGTMRYWKK